MKKLERKVQMMDAGGALFTSKDGFGTALGQVRSELLEIGKVYRSNEIDKESLPSSTEEFDLLVDFSTPWRKRYISCLVEDAGDTLERSPDGEVVRRYSARFKQGDRSTPLRSIVFALLAAGSVVVGSFMFEGPLFTLLGIILGLLFLWWWTSPSNRAVHLTKETIKALSSIQYKD